MVILSILLIRISIIAKKNNENKEGFYNSLTGSFVILSIGIYYIIFTLLETPIIIYPFNALIVIWTGIILIAQIIYIFLNIFIKSLSSNLKPPKYLKNSDFNLKHEFRRKSSHLFGVLLIICYFWISFPVFNFVQQLIIQVEKMHTNIWGIVYIIINPEYIPRMITVFGFICTLILIIIPDIIRVFKFKYTLFRSFAHIMRKKEENAIGPHICLVSGSLFVMLIIPNDIISISGILIAIFSDAVASLVGKKFGKKRLPFAKRTNKTLEGFIAGFITAFLIPLPILILEFDLYISIILSIIGAVIISLIDIFTPLITDNFLNPILSSIGMYLTYLLIIL